MATSMLDNGGVVPLTDKADCGAVVELIVLLVELIPEILVLSVLSVLLTADVVEDSVVCAEGILSCC